jgi:hypothetical protein
MSTIGSPTVNKDLLCSRLFSRLSAFGTFLTHLFLFFTFHFLFFSLRGEDGQNGEVDVGRNLDVSLQLEVFT